MGGLIVRPCVQVLVHNRYWIYLRKERVWNDILRLRE